MSLSRTCIRVVSLSRAYGSLLPLRYSRTLHTSHRLWNSSEQGTRPGPTRIEETVSIQSTDLLDLYRGLVTRGDIEYDEDQVRAVMRLRRLTRELEDYVPNLVSGHAAPIVTPGSSWWTPKRLAEEGLIDPDRRALLVRKDMARELAELDVPQGVILIAPPGRGKTFILDMWLSSLPTKHKVRKHYSTLTLELYRAVWEETQHRVARHRAGSFTPASVAGRVKWTTNLKARWKALFDSGQMSLTGDPASTEDGGGDPNYVSELPMAQVLAARLLLRQGWLLHIDELQLLDIGSASILSDVLGHFWRMGGVVVATSNKVPGELYKNGLGAERVRVFISALEARCDVVTVGGEKDWRREGEEEGQVEGRGWYLVGEENKFEDMVKEVVKDRKETSRTLNIFNRRFDIPQIYLHPDLSIPPIARFTFAQLCNTALGTADYTTLASTFSTLILTDIPILRLSTKDQARRFIMLIDALYEARVKIVCLAEAKIDGLFFPDELAGVGEGEENARTMMEEALSEGNVTYRPNVSMYQEDQGVKTKRKEPIRKSDGLPLRELSIFTGQEEKFAYARATSRLVQMTSAKYARTAVWQPLAQVHQPWHLDYSPSPAPDSSTTSTPKFAAETESSSAVTTQTDWAAEASYDKRRGRSGRPEPPRLSENHAWGVREDWGKGAGEWGKGAQGKKGPKS
ncbi:ATPase [Ceratobasidium sp. AG-Ba]|nr:ATPase [Ceratobasidium sp. AG-Ba]